MYTPDFEEQEILEAMQAYEEFLSLEFDKEDFDFDYADYGLQDED